MTIHTPLETDVTTTDTTPTLIDTALARYSPSDAAIAKMAAEYMALVVAGEDDKHGHAVVRAARLVMRHHRTGVEKLRVAMKADALSYGQRVDGEARRLTAMMLPVEAHLQSQEDIVGLAAERRRKADEAKRLAVLRSRMDQLRAADSMMDPDALARLTDEDFDGALATARQLKADRATAERIAAEARRAEDARLATVRADLDRQRAAQEAEAAAEREAMGRERAAQEAAAAAERALQAVEAARLAAERRAIDDARLEHDRAVAAKVAAEAAAFLAVERARLDAEAKIADDARREAARPVAAKLLVLAEDVDRLASQVPDSPVADEVRTVLGRAADAIRAIADR